MAITSKGIEQWKVNNAEQLRSMIDDGYLTEKDVAKISDGDANSQIKAFNELGKKIQEMYSDTTLNLADENDLFDKDVIKNLRNFRESIDKMLSKSSLLSEKIRDQIDDSGIESPVLNVLKNHIKEMSDKDTREFIHNNREFLKHTFKADVLESIPDLNTQVDKSPDYGVQDTNFDEMFKDLRIEDVLDNYNEMDWDDIATIAKKQGITFKELMLQMQDAKIAKDRDDIIHGRWNNTGVPRDSDNPKKGKFWHNMGHELGGAAMTFFTPRRQEAFSRGENPSIKDYGLDLAENALYLHPKTGIGRGAKLLGATKVGSNVGKALGGTRVGTKVKEGGSKFINVLDNPITDLVVSNAAVPAAVEVMDSKAYDSDNPRGDFSWLDVLLGTGVNIATPYAMREGGGALLDKIGLKKIGGKLSNLGKGRTSKEMTDEVRQKIAKDNAILENYKGLRKGTRDPSRPTVNTRESFIQNIDADDRVRVRKLLDDYDAGGLDENYLKRRDFVLGVAESPGNTPSKKVENYQISRGKNPSDNYRLSEKQVPLYEALGLGATENTKSAGELIGELISQNYVSNKFGDALYRDTESKAAMLIPGISDINQWVKDINADKVRKKAIEKSKADERKGEGVLKQGVLQKAIDGKRRAKEQMEDMKKNLRRPGDISINRLFNNILRV